MIFASESKFEQKLIRALLSYGSDPLHVISNLNNEPIKTPMSVVMQMALADFKALISNTNDNKTDIRASFFNHCETLGFMVSMIKNKKY